LQFERFVDLAHAFFIERALNLIGLPRVERQLQRLINLPAQSLYTVQSIAG